LTATPIELLFYASLTDSSKRQGRRYKDGHALTRHGHRVRASPQPFRHLYFKDLLGFYASGGKDFVSGKQKSAIFELFRGAADWAGRDIRSAWGNFSC
jgi:hypothetical protein